MSSKERDESPQGQDVNENAAENGGNGTVVLSRETQKIMGALLKRRREARMNGSVSGADSSAILRQWRSERKTQRTV